jgi:ABC-type Fe3+/spermidine/putrescine transport system ATPase subunit
MTVTLHCTDLRKQYSAEDGYALGTETEGVSIDVEQGELFALLGPSGCGKTTTLRIIGGFIDATSGTVEINGVDVTGHPPYQRPTNTVFQSYALFPHMNVGANVAFGLSTEGVPRKDRTSRVAEALELVGLPGMEKRRVTELSGGQAQRAALARAIVKRPVVLLLDEPLGALDLRLRRQMQDELARLKGSIGTTFVHVTHDQEEACAIADRVAVMDRGRVVQVDSPVALFRSPRTSYVANFIDAGTIVRGTSERRGDVIEIGGSGMTVKGTAPGWLNGTRSIAAVLPPDRVRLGLALSSGAVGLAEPDTAHGEVQRVVFTGSLFEVYVRVREDLEVRSTLTVSEAGQLGDALTPGTRLDMSWSPNDVMFVEDVHEAAADLDLDPLAT